MNKGSKQNLRHNVGWATHLCLSESNNPAIQPSGRKHFKPSESSHKETSIPSLLYKAANLSNLPPRDPRSPRSIRDTTRQTLERSMQIASTSYSIEDWNVAASTGGPVVGDIVWKLANTLWRIFAQVRFHR
jgi:hypothetical protein